MNKLLLKEIITEQNKFLLETDVGVQRELLSSIHKYLSLPHVIVLLGIRRAGKSTLLTQILRTAYPEGVYYFNFEDERLLDFTVNDFNLLYECLVELYGKRTVFFLDEIQNIDKWELFVRRMQDREFKFFITGSNASLLNRELGKKLTGRHIIIKVLPFSFREFLRFKKITVSEQSLLDTAERGILKKFFNEYLQTGGMPEWLKYKDLLLLKHNYEDIIYRDIVTRHNIKSVKELRELALFLLTNVSSLFSYNKLKNMLHLGSANTAKNYVTYLEDSFLIYTTSKFSFKVAEQTVANKKAYCADNGIIEAVAFKFSKNVGYYLENLVFLELNRRGHEIYYYKTVGGFEVDFLLRKGRDIVGLVQVTEHVTNSVAKERELRALLTAMEETKQQHALLLTLDHSEQIVINDKTITVKPVYQWLLEENE